MATSTKKIETGGQETKKDHDVKAAAEVKAEKKATSNRKAVIEAFMAMEPKERSDLYTELQTAISHDNDLYSQGQSAGNEKYEALLNG